jgi:hypothetical protein
MTKPAPAFMETQTPQLNVERKLMQNYRVASAVHGGGEVAAVRNGSGQVEVFTLGTDGTLWNFSPDPNSDTGYSGVSISAGLKPKHIAAGVDSQGQLVVFMASGLTLSSIVETTTPGARWSQPTAVEIPLPPDPLEISHIQTQQIAGSLYVAVAIRHKLYPSTSMTGIMICYSLWDTKQPSFQKISPPPGSGTPCAWVGNSAQSAALAHIGAGGVGVNGSVFVYNIAARQRTTSQYLKTYYLPKGISATTDSHGNNHIFSIGRVGYTGDHDLSHLVGGENNQPYQLQQLSHGIDFHTIMAVADNKGTPHVFGVSSDHLLYHLEPIANSPTGYSDPAPIHSNVALLGAASNDSGAIDLFVVGTENSLTHLFLEEESGNWVPETVELPTGPIEPYISYATEITVLDAAGSPVVNADVALWASEETRLTVNGATYFVDPQRRAQTKTNSVGMLSVVQETGSLATPALLLTVPAMMAPDHSITIQPNADVQHRLASVNGTDLMNAKDAQGQFLLGNAYRTEQKTAGLASAVNQCMQLAGTPPVQAAPHVLTRHSPKPGVWVLPASAIDDLRLLTAPKAVQHWQLSFEGNDIVYRPLTLEEGERLLAEKRASLEAANDRLSWLGDIGDFVEGVVQGIVTVTDVIMTTVKEGIQSAITFVVNGVTYLFQTIVALIEQVFDLVETLFAQVKVGFEKLFEWLGFLFNWDDILRTKEALVYSINQFLLFLQGAAQGVQTIVDTGITSLQRQISDFFDRVIRTITDQSTVGGYVNSNQPHSPEVSSALSHNIVLNGLIEHAGKATPPAVMAAVNADEFEAFLEQVANFAAEHGGAFTSVTNFFGEIASNPGQMLNQLLKTLLEVVETVVQAILSGIKAIADAILQLVQMLVNYFQQALNEAWDIPFVSPFYSWLTKGGTLTSLDLIALITAIPTTLIYKLSKGASPFSTKESVTAFQNSFNAQSLLKAAGFIKVAWADENDEPAPAEFHSTPANILLVASGVSECIYGLISPFIDLQTVNPFMHKVALFFEVAAQGFSIPWITSPGSYDLTTADGVFKVNWTYELIGLILDAGYVFSKKTMPETFDDPGVYITTGYGVIHLALSIWYATFNEEPLHIAAFFMSTFSEISKILLLKQIMLKSKGISAFVCAGLDLIFLEANGGLLIRAAVIREN